MRENRRTPGGNDVSRAARLRKKNSKKWNDSYRRNLVSDRFPKTASKNIENWRYVMRGVHFHEIANGDTGG